MDSKTSLHRYWPLYLQDTLEPGTHYLALPTSWDAPRGVIVAQPHRILDEGDYLGSKVPEAKKKRFLLDALGWLEERLCELQAQAQAATEAPAAGARQATESAAEPAAQAATATALTAASAPAAPAESAPVGMRQARWSPCTCRLTAAQHLTPLGPLLGCHNPLCTQVSCPSEAQMQLYCCGGCGDARYCSRACQAQAWGLGHATLCGVSKN